MLTTEQIEKIIKLARDVEINSYELAVEHCEGYSYSGIAVCESDLKSSKERLVAYLNELKA